MRKVVSLLFPVFLLAGCVTSAPPVPGTAPAAKVRILQLNDIYKVEGLEGGNVGGLARVRTLRTQLESDGVPLLVLHAGDLLFPSVMSKFLDARPMIEVLNRLDGKPGAFDPSLIVTFGNHEFDSRDPGLVLGRMAQSDFRWISSNVRFCVAASACSSFARRVGNFAETVVVDAGGRRIGVLAITTDAQPRDYVAYRYADDEWIGATRDAVDALRRQGVDAIVAITHQDMAQDIVFAERFPEIDLVVGGHDHFFLKRQAGSTWITKGDADAASVLVHELTFSGTRAAVAEPRRVMLDRSVAADPDITAEVNRWMKELGRVVPEPQKTVGTTEHLLEGVEPAVRGRETALGNFLSDVLRARMKTDIAFINGGAIRINDNIPPGPVRNYDLEGIFYFDNGVVAFELTGAEIVDILRNSISRVDAGDGRFLQVSGIRFRYHVTRTADGFSYEVRPDEVLIARDGTWEPVRLDGPYTAASLDYIWEQGFRDGFALFSAGNGGSSPRRVSEERPDWRRTTEEAITAMPGQRITTAVEGRITRVENWQ